MAKKADVKKKTKEPVDGKKKPVKGKATSVKKVKKEENKSSKSKSVKSVKEEKIKEEKAEVEEKPKTKKIKIKRNVPQCNVYVEASFNNTIITITDPDGNTLASSSAGVVGFKGTKKSTAFAATKAAQDAVNKAQKYGIREAKVYIKGPGAGRNSAVKGLDASGLRITLLADVTTLPFDGCRARKMPRN